MKERGVGAPTFNNRLAVLSFFFATTCPRPEMKRHMRYQRAAKKIPAYEGVCKLEADSPSATNIEKAAEQSAPFLFLSGLCPYLPLAPLSRLGLRQASRSIDLDMILFRRYLF